LCPLLAEGDVQVDHVTVYRRCMHGRTMFVIAFCVGPLTADSSMFGVGPPPIECTSSTSAAMCAATSGERLSS
jgi:GTP-dependent phosphoenolpyruvate carboxykinase